MQKSQQIFKYKNVIQLHKIRIKYVTALQGVINEKKLKRKLLIYKICF